MYCGHCGTKMVEGVGCPRCEPVDVVLPGDRDDPPSLAGAIVMYGLLLGVNAVILISTRLSGPATADEIIGWMAGASIATAMLVLGAAWYYREWVLPRLRLPTGRWYLWALALAGVTITAVWIQGLCIEANPIVFPSSRYRLGMQLILVAAMPALFEELAFRGVVFASLERVMKQRECIIVSAFMFAILHLSLLSLGWLVLAGLGMGWLRSRSGSIWPGVLMHALHNLTVALLGWYT